MKKGEVIKRSELEKNGLEVITEKNGIALLKSDKDKAFYDTIVFTRGDEKKYQIFNIYKDDFIYNVFTKIYWRG